ncbi:Transcription factor [Cardamine amara subsp. amara]|uniref:Transcription factor n=1 Tax=Cardamine amara subsp. amara TaxID=228776 RepID=A0ABD1AEW8_CARAN
MDQSHSITGQSRSADRKTIERNRRMQMKTLFSELNSLLPHQSSRETLTLPDQLDEAEKYIKKLQVNVEKKRERKKKLVATAGSSSFSSNVVDVSMSRRQPKIEIQETGSVLHVFLVTSLEHKFIFHESIRVITEEFGAEITYAGYSIVDDAVFHTLHCKVEECESGARSRISDRLEKVVNSVN